jgi:hypothetical protein
MLAPALVDYMSLSGFYQKPDLHDSEFTKVKSRKRKQQQQQQHSGQYKQAPPSMQLSAANWSVAATAAAEERQLAVCCALHF